MERPFSYVPGRAAFAVRDDILLSRLATQARPPLAGWPLGSPAAGAHRAVFDTRRHVIEFPDGTTGSLEITEGGSSAGRQGNADAVRIAGCSSLTDGRARSRGRPTAPGVSAWYDAG